MFSNIARLCNPHSLVHQSAKLTSLVFADLQKILESQGGYQTCYMGGWLWNRNVFWQIRLFLNEQLCTLGTDFWSEPKSEVDKSFVSKPCHWEADNNESPSLRIYVCLYTFTETLLRPLPPQYCWVLWMTHFHFLVFFYVTSQLASQFWTWPFLLDIMKKSSQLNGEL